MDATRIAALLKPFLAPCRLDPAQLNQISTYIDLLQRWNARINLTAIRTEEEIITRHFGESFFLARHLFPDRCHPERSGSFAEREATAESKDPYPSTASSPHVLDLGSGAGFPALPIKIWNPSIRLTLVESNHKKAAFLREAARALTLTNINVIPARAETLIEKFRLEPENHADVITLRAVEHFEAILQTAAALLPLSARLAILIGASQLPYLPTHSGIVWNTPINVPQSQSRCLLIGIKNRSGPD